jgi:hypothetical protein
MIFQLLCSGLPQRNTNLRTLTADLKHVMDDTLELALAPTSPLKALHIAKGGRNGWVAHTIGRHLQNNATLLELRYAERVGNDPVELLTLNMYEHSYRSRWEGQNPMVCSSTPCTFTALWRF